MATTTKTLLTAEEFMEQYADHGPCELVNGEVIELPYGTLLHGRVCANIGYVLYLYGRESGFGHGMSNDTAIVTTRGPDTVRGADVCFYSKARLHRSEIGWELPKIVPDLAIEVYDPPLCAAYFRQKISEYLDAGIAIVWVVDAARERIVVYRPDDPVPVILTAEAVLENLPELPGFRCPVAEFFV